MTPRTLVRQPDGFARGSGVEQLVDSLERDSHRFADAPKENMVRVQLRTRSIINKPPYAQPDYAIPPCIDMQGGIA